MSKNRVNIDKLSINETMLLLDIYRGTNKELNTRSNHLEECFAFLKGKDLIRGTFDQYKNDIFSLIITMKGMEYVNLLVKL